ncbi:MAG: bifunctional adenosylcobinamide kinase/adenosylcobinamide-phosphate guanylyltransferase [Microcoleaceae cyanobacterium]
MIRQIILVTGPARSGKSEWAEYLAKRSGHSVCYIATSKIEGSDTEWLTRIQQHQERRPAAWRTLEAPVELAATLQNTAQPEVCLLVDSLGTWLANLLDQDQDTWNDTQDTLLRVLAQAQGQIILVAEEAGWGVVPAYPIGRTFRDRLGGLARQIGAMADTTYLVTGGHALNLSQLGCSLTEMK